MNNSMNYLPYELYNTVCLKWASFKILIFFMLADGKGCQCCTFKSPSQSLTTTHFCLNSIIDSGLTDNDVSSRPLESCFRSALTHRKPPLFCQQGYLRQQGLPHDSRPWQNFYFTKLVPVEHDDAGTSGADPALPSYLAPAGASMSTGLKLDF